MANTVPEPTSYQIAQVQRYWYSTLAWPLRDIISKEIKQPGLHGIARPDPEPLDSDEYLEDMLGNVGKSIQRVVVMGLGTLEKARTEEVPDNYRSYLMARKIVCSLLEVLRKEYRLNMMVKPHVDVVFEDASYTDDDLIFLKKGFIIGSPSPDITVGVHAHNDGSGWISTWPTANRYKNLPDDYMFITFNTKPPIRQVLAGYVCGPEPPNPIPGDEVKPMKPKAIICRPYGEQDDASTDTSDERVKKLMEDYTAKELLPGNAKGLGHSVLHILKPGAQS